MKRSRNNTNDGPIKRYSSGEETLSTLVARGVAHAVDTHNGMFEILNYRVTFIELCRDLRQDMIYGVQVMARNGDDWFVTVPGTNGTQQMFFNWPSTPEQRAFVSAGIVEIITLVELRH